MKKSFLIGILIIIMGGLVTIVIMGYLGRYPSFFPDFIKYNKFFPQIVTREVFKIENFSDPEEDFSGFLKEVENTVRKFWREDANLIYIAAYFIPETNKEAVAYEMAFESKEPFCHILQISYNVKIVLQKGPYFDDPVFGPLYARGHWPKFTDSENLIAIERIEPYCLGSIGQRPIEEIKISGKQAFQLALMKKPELINMREGDAWFGWFRYYANEAPPFWYITGGARINIDAKTGEILEEI